jgi:hypothetical protein
VHSQKIVPSSTRKRRTVEDELYTRFEEYEEEMWVGWRRISDATEWPMIEKDLMIELT